MSLNLGSPLLRMAAPRTIQENVGTNREPPFENVGHTSSGIRVSCFPCVGFMGAILKWSSRRAVRFFSRRGRAEQWIKGITFALNWTRFSCHDLEDNQTRLPATSGFALAYNLGNPDVRRN